LDEQDAFRKKWAAGQGGLCRVIFCDFFDAIELTSLVSSEETEAFAAHPEQFFEKEERFVGSPTSPVSCMYYNNYLQKESTYVIA
jgi:hypothetical protein